jgi:hypothetical protein
MPCVAVSHTLLMVIPNLIGARRRVITLLEIGSIGHS